MTEKIEIYTDGSVLVNPNGPGGWAFVVVRDGDAREQVSAHSPSTTNNIMEMQAVLEAMRFIPEPFRFTVISDSQYVVKGITEWVPKWKSNGWHKRPQMNAEWQRRNPQKVDSPIANLELWKELDAAYDPTRMSVEWIKGHAGQSFNEIADYLAGREAHCYA